MTMSISSAPAATASRVSWRRTSSELCPDGNAVATLATCTPEPSTASRATPTSAGYTQTAAQLGISGRVGAGQTALAASWRTLPGVSAPSSVVRSSIETARRMPCFFASVLIERLASVATRSSTATRSTCGRRRAVLTPSSLRRRPGLGVGDDPLDLGPEEGGDARALVRVDGLVVHPRVGAADHEQVLVVEVVGVGRVVER